MEIQHTHSHCDTFVDVDALSCMYVLCIHTVCRHVVCCIHLYTSVCCAHNKYKCMYMFFMIVVYVCKH